MSGIAEKLDATFAPALRAFAAEKTELVASSNLAHQCVQPLAGKRCKLCAHRFRVILCSPGFLGPLFALATQDDIDQVATAQEVTDAIVIRAHPRSRTGRTKDIGRQVFSLEQRPPRDLPGEYRIF